MVPRNAPSYGKQSIRSGERVSGTRAKPSWATVREACLFGYGDWVEGERMYKIQGGTIFGYDEGGSMPGPSSATATGWRARRYTGSRARPSSPTGCPFITIGR